MSSLPKDNIFSLGQLQLDSTTKPADILAQLPSYNNSGINDFIRDLESEVDDQKRINMLLKDDGYKQHINSIQKFIKENKNGIKDQLDRLLDTCEYLKGVISENDKLIESKKEFTDLIKSDECLDLANKLRQIKSIKQTMRGFLKEKGLWDDEMT